MRYDRNDCKCGFSRYEKDPGIKGNSRALFPFQVVCVFLVASVLFASCGKGERQPVKAGDRLSSSTVVGADTAAHGKTMEQLLDDYDRQSGKQRLATANKVFGVLYRMEFTESLLTVTPKTHPDSVDLLVWYWASEYYYDTQDYVKGLRYATQALPLAWHGHDLLLQGDCENIAGLHYFRLSDYAHAIEHVRKSLAIDRQIGDKSRISSSLNTLAGIWLVAKQLKDGERYIKEALRYSTAAKDSDRMAIQYGMASEICHVKGKNRQALENARCAYAIDSVRGNTAKVGIRLSQMAAAQLSLGQFAAAERSVRRAIPILKQAGNGTSLAICHNQMGELLNHRGAHVEAARYFRQAAESFAQRKDMYNESRAQIGLYEAMKDSNPKEAAIHMKRYAQLKDSIYKHDMEQAVSQYNVKYKTEEFALQRDRDRLKQRINLVVGIVLVCALLTVIAWLMYVSRVHRRHHELEKKVSKMRERFFTNITHEFRTPLTLIIGLSHDLASDEASTEEARGKAESINRQGNSLLKLINQLLDAAKVKSEVGNANWRNGNITAYIEMIVESYRDYARSSDITLSFISKEAVVMDFVPDYVSKIMNNLLSNSLKFTPAYGRVGATLWREGKHLHLDVADTGKGMDQETVAHVFEPFYQAEGDTQNIGTGIGLSFVKQLVDALGGTITVESEAGRGTIFQISLPIHQNIQQKVDADPMISKPVLSQVNAMPKDPGEKEHDCRVLVIEDNHDVATYIGSLLSDEYDVYYAANGREGLKSALDIVPDLIITDLMMPEMDGLEVCRQVRANEIINHIPIIVVTAKITAEERLKGLEAGADAYLAKPFNADELRTRVRKLLDTRRLLREKFSQIMVEGNDKDHKQDNTSPCDADLQFLIKVSDAVNMQLNRNGETNVSLIASMMCMSNSQFYRKMVAITGYTPVAYIQRIKIKKAMKLLDEDSKVSMAEVAYRCGFDVYPNFVRAFKKVCGVTPTDYRKGKEVKEI